MPSGWFAVGGTSAAAPQWAALVALADQGRGAAGPLDGVTQTLPALYQLAANANSYANDFNDITSGNNGLPAQVGYDLVTGLGTPRANNLIPALETYGAATNTFNITASTGTPTAGTSFSLTVTAEDPSGKTLTGYAGTVHFTSTDSGKGVALPGDYTFTSGDNGVHTFSGVTLVTAGSQTITAADTGTSTMTGSATVTVSPAAAKTLAVTGFPSPIAAGTSGNFTVTALDAYGNTATGYGGTVAFTSSDGQAKLPANSTLTQGTGTFSATLNTTGTQSLTATDPVTNSITGSQAGIVVTSSSSSGPTVQGLSSSTGSTAGGYMLAIYGSNLNGATAVYFGTAPAGIVSDSPTTISVVVPAHAAGTVDVTVVTPAGTSPVTAADRFTYAGAPGSSKPVVQTVNPNVGPTGGGTMVVISGTSLATATAVYFGNTPATILGTSATAIGVMTPAHAAGTVDVTVVTPAGTSTPSPADHFTFVSNPVSQGPTVQGVSPNTGPTAGGEMVVLSGTNLAGATAVYLARSRRPSSAPRHRRSALRPLRTPRAWWM